MKKFRDTIYDKEIENQPDYDERQHVDEKFKTALDDVTKDPSNPEKLAHFKALKEIRDASDKFRKEAKESGASKVQETFAYRIPMDYPEAYAPSSSKFGGLRGMLESTKNKLFPSKVKTQKAAIVREEIPEEEQSISRAPASIKEPVQQGIAFDEFYKLPEEAQDELRRTHLYNEKTDSYLPRDLVLGKKK